MQDLACLLLNWNQLSTTLERLDELRTWQRLRPEVWVVDNGSEDGATEKLGRRHPEVRLLASDRNLGFGGGNNLALREITARRVLLLNSDAGLDEAGAGRLCSLLEERPRCAVAGPLLTERGATAVAGAGGRDILRHVRTHLGASDLPRGRLESGEPYEVDYVPGTVALLSMAALEEVGLFDEDFFFGGELADLCHRLRRAGWSCLVLPSVRAWHDRSLAGDHRPTLYAYYILRNRFLYLRKWARGPARCWWLFWTAYGVASSVRHLVAAHRSTARAEWLALRDGLGGRFGGRDASLLP